MRYKPKRLTRLSAAILLLALLSGLAASWLWSGRVRSAQVQERRDLNLFLDASSAGWAEVTDQFFRLPEAEARTIGALAGRMDSDERLVLLIETIRTSSSIDGAFIGYPNGEFLFAARSDEAAPGGFRTRQIKMDGDERSVVLTRTDAARTELSRTLDPDDQYDPRERPWYLKPGGPNASNWTAPYLFSSSQQPGITYSTRFLDDQGEQAGVVGIDIRLTELAGFLDQLAPGSNGAAMVLDVEGEIIAASTMDSPAASLDEFTAVSDENMSVLAGAVERVRSGDSLSDRSRSKDGLRTTVTRAVRGPDDWYLTVQAEDSDFLGDFSSGSFKNWLGILAIGLASAIIIGSLGYRWLRYQDTLKAEAERDELTGLFSRRALRRALEARLAIADEPVAVAIVDLDRFKAVNDGHGHLIGDDVLAAMASRIELFAQDHQAMAGRLGGDEFALIGSPDTDWGVLVAQLSQTLTVGSQPFQLGASVGIAHAFPGDPRPSGEEILRAADHALFSVKRAGGGRVEFAEMALDI